MSTTALDVDLLEQTDRPCPGGHDPAETPLGQPVWCLDCEQRIAQALAPPAAYPAILGIADLVARVAARRDGRLPESSRPAARATRSSGRASTSPGFDEVDYITRWATDLATDLAGALGHQPTDDDAVTARHLPQLAWALAYLHGHLRRALTIPGAETFGLRVLREHRRLQRLAGEQDLRRRLRTPCPACDTLAVIREDGCDRVECIHCRMTWSEDSFQRALRASQHPAAPIPRARRHKPTRQSAAASGGGRA